MFAGGSYEEVARWLLVFLNSHAKRESPRIEAIVETGDARARKSFGVRLRLEERYEPPLDRPAVDFSFQEVSAGKGSFPWCEALGKRVRAWARQLCASDYEVEGQPMNIASLLAVKSGQPITIRPERSVKEAVALLARHNIGVLIVVNEANVPVGIISERDIVREAARNEQVFGRTVGEIMTRDVITGVPEDDLASVANVMTEKRIRHVPVVDKGRLVGIVSIGDVVKAQRDKYRGEVETLETQILADEN